MISKFALFVSLSKLSKITSNTSVKTIYLNGFSRNSGAPPSPNRPHFSGLIPLDDLNITYSTSSGPGGQHVNKTQSKVEVRFHVQSASWIPDELKSYILEKESHRITKDGYFIIQSDRTRQQFLNQADCLERIRRMLRERLHEMYKPEPTEETLEQIRKRRLKANETRLQMKRNLSMTKAYRQKPDSWDM